MLTAEQNERLTRVGAGTPMGELLRRYWQPIAPTAELLERPAKAIRLMGEDLTLFRDKQGRLGLIGERCAHRLVRLEFGYPVDEGLRCPYHGWTYNASGQCVAQPAEPPESTFKDKVKLKAYPVQELAGLVFAYLGPEPAPLLPCWEPLVAQGLHRELYYMNVPCNWLQGMENSPDWSHVEWLHGHFTQYVLESRGVSKDDARYKATAGLARRVLELAHDRYEHGILRRVLNEGSTKEDDRWRVGQPVIMPNINVISAVSSSDVTVIWRTAVDDTHMIQWDLRCFLSDSEASPNPNGHVPYAEMMPRNEHGAWNLEQVRIQDYMVYMAQGEIVDRTQERLGGADQGVILYRQMLEEQLELIEAGQDPMNVFRDPAANRSIHVPVINPAYRRRDFSVASA
ncbi:MAG TPA: Rieske 2Fe-2S domain-containing protein [Chloroflexota bacterium]